MSNRQDLSSKLVKARQQLKKVQQQVVDLESQLLGDQPKAAILPSEDRYHHVFDNMLEGVEIIGFDWRYVYVNDAAVIHGRQSREVLLQSTVQELYSGIENTEMFAALKMCMEQRTMQHFETEFVFPDGVAVWFELRVHAVPEGVFILSLDISERKQAEKELHRYAQRMEILHEIDVGIIEATSIETVVEAALVQIRSLFACEQALAGVFDYKTNESVIFACDLSAPFVMSKGTRFPIRQGIFDDFNTEKVVVIDDIQLLPESEPAYATVKKVGLRSALRALLTFHGQPLGILTLNAAPPNFFTAEQVEVAGEIANQLAIAIHQMQLSQALTQHAETVDEMRQFLQTTLDGFPANTVVLDPDGTIIKVNLPWKKFADDNGGDSLTHYLGSNYLTVCATAVGLMADEAASAAAGIGAVIRGARDQFKLEYPCDSLTGERWFMLYVTPFTEAVPRRVVLAHINITERKLAEKAEREQRLLAETLRDSLAVLTASLDVETVMQKILAYSANIIPSEAGTIILYEGDQGRVAYSRGYSAEAEAFFRDHLIPLKAGLYVKSHDKEAFYFAADTTLAPDWVQFPFTDWIRSSIGVPIILRGESIGLLIADSGIPNQFQQKDVEHLKAFARYAALALENVYYIDQLERRVNERTAELQGAKGRVEAILNNSADGILLAYHDFTIQQTNAAFNRLFACDQDDYFNQPLTVLLEAGADDLMTKTMLAGVAEGQVVNMEVRARRKNATGFDGELSIGYIKKGGFVCSIRDITERKVQERQLRYHASLQQNVSDAVIVTDTDFRIQSWNKAAERIYGWPAEEVVNQATAGILNTQFLPPGDNGRSRQQLHEKGWWQGEVIQTCKDGSFRHMLGSINLVKDENGMPFGVVAVNRDITERKIAEEALQQSAAEIHDLYNNAPCGYHSIDQDGVIVQINDTELHWLGYSRDEVVGKLKITDLFTPESVLNFQKTFPLFKELGQISDLEFDLIRKDRSILHVMVNATAIYDKDGHYQKSRSSLFDMTDLAEAQSALVESGLRYRLLAENVTDVIAKVSLDGVRTYVTPSCYALLGYTPEELVGQRRDNIVHPDDRLRTQAILKESIDSGNAFVTLTERMLHKDGHYVPVEIASSTVRDPASGKPVEYIGVIRDISERKRAEEVINAKAVEEREFQQYLKALQEITIELTQIDGLDAFYKRVVELGLERLGFERLALFLYDEKDEMALGTYGTDPQGIITDERQVRFVPNPNAIMRRAFNRAERFYFEEHIPLYNSTEIVGVGWNAATVLWNGRQSLGWLVADNLLSQKPASKPLLDILGLYGLAVGTLLAQKRTQLDLRESESLYRLLAENITDVVVRSNAIGEYTYVSPSSRAVMGYEPEELLGKTIAEYVNPDDLTTIVNGFVTALASVSNINLVVRFRHKLGHYIWLETIGLAMRSAETGEIQEYITSSRDISDRKRAEAALKESEEKFRLLLDAAPVATIISDAAGHITLVNVQAENLFGFQRTEMIGQMVDMLVPDYARDVHVHNHQSYVAAPRVRQMGSGLELFAKRKDASEFPVEIELSYVQTKDGVMVMSFVIDITERKQASAELERQRSFLRSVIDVSPSMIFVKDYAGNFILANPMTAKFYDTTVDSLIGNNDADFNPSLPEVEAFLKGDREVITSGKPLFMEELVTNLSGQKHWIQTTKVPIISVDGKSNNVLGIATDITERKHAESALKESEEKYRSLVETMRGGLAIFDLDGKITYINDRFCELVGYSREEVIGTIAADYVDVTNLPTLKSELNRRQELESSSYELLFRHKDGSPVYLLVSGSPLFGKNGEHRGSFAVVTDISAQKQAEDALRQALVTEKELGELKSRFVSMASHEFRTPLATILALTETLSAYRHQLPEDQIEERFDKIKDQVGHLKDIMEDVLLLARMQARRGEFNPVMLDLDNLCRSVLDEYQSQADVKQQLDYICGGSVHELKLDRKLMRQIISNVVSNAIKYSPDGKTIVISLEFDVDKVVLKVRDEGIGIPEADLKHLFEPFHRASNVGAISGTGLGLVITKESVELHGGTITIESEIDVGTTFTIQIPISSWGENDDDTNPGN